MAIVGPDGTPTESGSKLLLAIKAGCTSPDSISRISGLPTIIVRDGLKDLERSRLVRKTDEGYELDDRGQELLR